MNLKKIVILVFLIVSNIVFAQQTVNHYKYVIIPQKYEFLKTKNQHQLNTLTKFLFKKEGFTALFDTDRKPQDLTNNPCLALLANVRSNSGMFTTKLHVELTNCKNEIVFTSTEGKSKVKDYRKAYHEALRNTFKSITALDYAYTPNTFAELKPVPDNSLKKIANTDTETASEKIEQLEDIVMQEVISEEAPGTETVDFKTPLSPPSKPIYKEEETKKPKTLIADVNTLYAQANGLGYQLVDSTPKVVYVLLKSAREHVYFLRNKRGIVYKENEQWIVEYYDLDTLVRKGLAIKF